MKAGPQVTVCQSTTVRASCTSPSAASASSSLFDGGPADFVADGRGSRVTEKQIEGGALGVVGGVVARRDRPGQSRRDVGVEPDFALVESERLAGVPAAGVGGGDLEHDRPWAGAVVRVGQCDAVALAHLADADAFDGENGDGAVAENSGQPVGAESRGAFDEKVCGTSPAMNLAVRPAPLLTLSLIHI